MAAQKKVRLAPIDPGPSAESLAIVADGALKKREAAKFIGKSVRFLEQLTHDGRFPNSFMHGRDRNYPVTELRLYLAEVRDRGLAS